MVLPLKSFNDTQIKTFQFFKRLLLNNIYIYIIPPFLLKKKEHGNITTYIALIKVSISAFRVEINE